MSSSPRDISMPSRLIRPAAPPSRSWMVAFQGCDDADLLILQQLLSGMNAHINLDLGVAAAQVSPGAQLPSAQGGFRPDQRRAGQPGRHRGSGDRGGLSAHRRSGKDRLKQTRPQLVNFDMTAARDAAWLTAEHLAWRTSIRPCTMRLSMGLISRCRSRAARSYIRRSAVMGWISFSRPRPRTCVG